MDDAIDRALRARAASAVDHARSLASLDPAWGSETHALAGGWLVLSGAGMYVNRAMAAGIEIALSDADLDSLVALSVAAGVVPAFEVTGSTRRETLDRLRSAGFVHDAARDVALLTRPVGGHTIDGPGDVVAHAVRSLDDLRLWQHTAATGWGHTTTEARRASDAFAAAVFALEIEHLFVALDSADGRPIGCAASTIRDGLAIFGGMCTVPTERRRGVQAALLGHRLEHAARYGCDLVATTAAAGGASERNLQRHGFMPQGTIKTFSPPAG